MFINFVEDCLSGNASLSDLDDYIDYWHEHDMEDNLQSFLGMTDYESTQWGMTNDYIFKDILECRKCGIDLEDFQLNK